MDKITRVKRVPYSLVLQNDSPCQNSKICCLCGTAFDEEGFCAHKHERKALFVFYKNAITGKKQPVLVTR